MHILLTAGFIFFSIGVSSFILLFVSMFPLAANLALALYFGLLDGCLIVQRELVGLHVALHSLRYWPLCAPADSLSLFHLLCSLAFLALFP